MGRHRKRTHSVLWDYAAIWGWPATGIAGIFFGILF